MAAVLIVLSFVGCKSEPASKQPAVASAPEARVPASASIEVFGDVSVTLIDAANRRSGWEGHRVEEIPGCKMELADSEIAEPMEYAFRWDEEMSESMRLHLRPRTEGSVTIVVRSIASSGTHCSARDSMEVGDEGEVAFTVLLEATGTRCTARLRKLARE